MHLFYLTRTDVFKLNTKLVQKNDSEGESGSAGGGVFAAMVAADKEKRKRQAKIKKECEEFLADVYDDEFESSTRFK